MNDWTSWIPLIAAFLLFLGTLVTVWATRGRTQSDFKTALDKRLDEKMLKYQEGLEEERDGLKQNVADLTTGLATATSDISGLKSAAERTARRETLLFFYVSSLRDHIMRQLPPPPPEIPVEISDWFEDLEATLPRGTA